MLKVYLLLGLGAYLGASASRWKTFIGTTWQGFLRGLALGILLWPVALGIVAYNHKDDK